jgi:hypothetical protein
VSVVERLKAAKRAATFTFGVDGSKIIVIMVSSMGWAGLAGLIMAQPSCNHLSQM